MSNKRVFLIVLDSFGIGEMADAPQYGDENVNTLRSVAASSCFRVPNLERLGLFQIDGVAEEPAIRSLATVDKAQVIGRNLKYAVRRSIHDQISRAHMGIPVLLYHLSPGIGQIAQHPSAGAAAKLLQHLLGESLGISGQRTV